MNKQMIKFSIERIDPLGQGVSKSSSESEKSNQITFIKKTLPGEQGIAEVFKRKGKVNFARVKELTQTSSKRVASVCPHYNECSGCHFLHTDYNSERQYKAENFEREIKRLNFKGDIHFTPAPSRLGYRNRIQLHYDLQTKKLGYLASENHQILAVSQCLLPNLQIQKELQKLYNDDYWIQLVLKSGRAKQTGHIEIYDFAGELRIEINRPYAYGGFEQVNSSMNKELQKKITTTFQKLAPPPGMILDLFGGNGNLTGELKDYDCLVVDSTEASQVSLKSNFQTYFQNNLYSPRALDELKSALKRINTEESPLVCAMFVDPPRSGLKNLADFTRAFSPKYLFYVSCHWATLLRDISTLCKAPNSPYQIKHAELLDFFPSTYHFECFLILENVEKCDS